MKKIKNRLSVYTQGWLWVFGINKHNSLRGECTPDFSCCCKSCHTPFHKRLWYMVKYPFWSIRYNLYCRNN